MPGSVLFVCTGNVCRSPLAERLLRAAVHPTHALEVRSAGLRALVGQPMDPPSATALAELGGDPSGHHAQQFELALASASDLVLTAESAHRDEIFAASPRLYRRTFTMKEFVRLLPPGPVLALPDAVAVAAARRGQVEVVPAEADDITDPFRSTNEQARAMAEQVAAVVTAMVAALGLDRVAPTEPRRPRPHWT